MSQDRKDEHNIGLDVPLPATDCSDGNCPFHGGLPVRGQLLVGTVVSNRMVRSVVVERTRRFYVKKYERFEKRTSRYIAHLPDCIPVTEGDEVTIAECRKLSKNKTFVVVENKSLKEAVSK